MPFDLAAVRSDWAAADKHLPQVAALLGGLLIKPASLAEDRHQCTDLKVDFARIAVRLRGAEYRTRYPHELTLRADRPSSRPAELTKIIDGHGDWLFYGFLTPDSAGVADWLVLSLAGLRAALVRRTAPFEIRRNRDESAGFATFPVAPLRLSLLATSPSYWALAPSVCPHPCCQRAAAVA